MLRVKVYTYFLKHACIERDQVFLYMQGFMINIIIYGHHNTERQSWHIVQNLLQQIQSWIWLCVTIQKHADSEYKTLVFSLTFSYCLISFFFSFISIFGIEHFLLKSKIEKKYGWFFMSNYGTVNHKQPIKILKGQIKQSEKRPDFTYICTMYVHTCTRTYTLWLYIYISYRLMNILYH